jgi:hypothetical protein
MRQLRTKVSLGKRLSVHSFFFQCENFRFYQLGGDVLKLAGWLACDI